MAITGEHLTRGMVYARSRMGSASIRALFTDIWHHYYPRVHVFIQRMLADPADADDATQEAMIKVFQKLRQYRPDYAVSTWIYAIARNHCLDRIRSERIRAPMASIGEPDCLPGLYASPEEAFLRRELMLQTVDLVRTLSPEDQQIAFLHFFEEMPYRQVSMVMAIPIGTLKYRVHRIRQVLRGERED